MDKLRGFHFRRQAAHRCVVGGNGWWCCLAVTVKTVPAVPSCYPGEPGAGGHGAHTVLTGSRHHVAS